MKNEYEYIKKCRLCKKQYGSDYKFGNNFCPKCQTKLNSNKWKWNNGEFESNN